LGEKSNAIRFEDFHFGDSLVVWRYFAGLTTNLHAHSHHIYLPLNDWNMVYLPDGLNCGTISRCLLRD
jgi:hypothetical protein